MDNVAGRAPLLFALAIVVRRGVVRGLSSRTACALALLSLFATQRARATYSIIALDLTTGDAGGAGTSCVGAQLSVYEIFGPAPGAGVVVAQAALNLDGRDRAVELLGQGAAAPDVIAEITGADFDFAAAVRQYAVIDARGMAAGFTGDATMPYADDVQGRAGEVVYSVQGNILTGEAVLVQAAAVFSAPGCDLADTLMLALEAGAHGGQGDSRCTPDGIPSDGAFVRVDRADGAAAAPYLELQVDDTRPDDPLVALRERFDAWRADHPCPDPPDAGPVDGGAAADASVPEPGGSVAPPVQAGAAAAGAGGSAGPASAAGVGGGAGAAGAAAAATGGGGGLGSSGPPAAVPPASHAAGDGGGCSVTGGRQAPSCAVALFVTALALRRRRRLSAPRPA